MYIYAKNILILTINYKHIFFIIILFVQRSVNTEVACDIQIYGFLFKKNWRIFPRE